MLKISASYSKKVPGVEQYSSEGYYVSIEAEVPQSLLGDPQALQSHIQELFQEVRTSVEQELGGGVRESGPTRPHLVGRNGNGNGNSQGDRQPAKASNRQISFLCSLAKRVADLSPDDLARSVGLNRLDELSSREASDLIERLKSKQAVGK